MQVAETRAQLGIHARYTLCGDLSAEARVNQDLSRLTTGIDSELGDELRALVLAGPFARAEGGVVYRDGEPYADGDGYQLLSVFRHRYERHDRRAEELSALWTRMLNARVSLRPLSLHELERVQATRFWFHAGRGWLIALLGDPAICLAIPRREPTDLREDEAARALCEGFSALALCSLGGDGEDTALIHGMHRAVLACGDAVLIRRGQYADTLSKRAAALDAIHATAALRAAYRDAIAFCSRPDVWLPESRDVASWAAGTRRLLSEALVHAHAEELGSARHLLGLLASTQPLFRPVRTRKRSAVRRVLRSLPRPGRSEPWRVDPLERLLRSSIALALGTYAPECRKTAAKLLGLPAAHPTDDALAGALSELTVQSLAQSRLEHPFALIRRDGRRKSAA